MNKEHSNHDNLQANFIAPHGPAVGMDWIDLDDGHGLYFRDFSRREIRVIVLISLIVPGVFLDVGMVISFAPGHQPPPAKTQEATHE
jgi:hypothetical protein